jgi:hypothetical protein
LKQLDFNFGSFPKMSSTLPQHPELSTGLIHQTYWPDAFFFAILFAAGFFKTSGLTR